MEDRRSQYEEDGGQEVTERESLNSSIVDAINQASDYWGIKCLRYEIKDIHVPPKVREAMQMQVEAERRKRAMVLESEGTRESAINVAEGEKQAQILASEAERAEQINQAAGEANAILAKAKARGEAIRLVADALTQQVTGLHLTSESSAVIFQILNAEKPLHMNVQSYMMQ
ncbi:hypothetical protein GDO81_002965 [Engystomops pustulosus]|uniref:Band 7 domain-containing protein n=1 Tax=Engystomops pustulosus TaxID=76066 RepID=A0AAV7DRN1_ENGPU|nr:hypothetical protein GDO81_002965 [Engystomops pustulosus]